MIRPISSILLFVGLLMATTACGGDAVDPDLSEYPPDLPLDAAYTECELVDDCVVVELGCCDDCNGGLAVAVNVSSEPDVVDRFTEVCDDDQACTEIGCPAWVLSCDDGACGLGRGTFK